MIEIRINGEPLDIPEGFSMDVEETNPVFNDRGSQTMPATVPASRRNLRILGAPHRIDWALHPNDPARTAEVIEGGHARRGVVNVTEAGRTAGITFNVGFDNSTVYAAWQQKKLAELQGLPVVYKNYSAWHVGTRLDAIYRGEYDPFYPFERDLAVFPVAIGKEEIEENNRKKTYWEILNVKGTGDWPFISAQTVKRVIDGTVTDVTVPPGYGASPFLRVWRVLELIFADMGLTVIANPFKDSPELERLVVLNNAADAICRGKVDYSDLLPDCTVAEFLDALWARFGLVYSVDFSNMTASLRLLKDIIGSPAIMDLASIASEDEKVVYLERQYLTLSASTSLEGAEPATDRWEDFIRGLDAERIHQGYNVADWTYHPNNETWEGDVRDEYYPYDSEDLDREYPDPMEPWDDAYDYWLLGGGDDDRDDGRDDDRADTRAIEPSAQEDEETEEETSDTFLAREFVSGNWYKLDSSNGTVRVSSSPFFKWDTASEGLSPLEITSKDECVPVGRVSNLETGTGNEINALMPLYLTGARHYHTYIAGSGDGSDSTDDSGQSTPLAFMLAFTSGGKTVGRYTSENENGGVILPDDGSEAKLSLLWQFRDGLFSRFWKGYDEILRHGNRRVETTIRMNKYELMRLDMLGVYTFRGIRCLIDTIEYSLPSRSMTEARLQLRTISTQGDYDIRAEQGIPSFSAGARHLEWVLYKENFGPSLASEQWKGGIVAQIYNDLGYQDHASGGYEFLISMSSIEVTGMTRHGHTWRTDPELPEVTGPGNSITRTYKARIAFDVYEMRESPDGTLQPWGEPIHTLSDIVDYTVILRPVWVSD